MRTFLIIDALIVLSALSTIFIGSLYIIRRPHWGKIFFSYSHKDTQMAERIMYRLREYNFRVYIDFGLVIPEDQLENELSKTIKKRDIFILLASKNSAESGWVRYEIKRAQKIDKKRFNQWRDMIVLALDDRGIELANAITNFDKERMRAYWDSELGWSQKMEHEEPSERVKKEAGLKKGRQALDLFPFLRRILTPSVATFDLRGILPDMGEVEEYLKQETRFFRAPKNPTYAKALKVGQILWLTVLFIEILAVATFLAFLIL